MRARQAAACESVGINLCAKVYSCYSGSDIADMQYPPTQAECVTQMNADCGSAAPTPGYCKGSPQTSAQAATACATELDGLSCTEFEQPSGSGACKTELCQM